MRRVRNPKEDSRSSHHSIWQRLTLLIVVAVAVAACSGEFRSEISIPEVTTPDATTPETTTPEATVPDVTDPEAGSPEEPPAEDSDEVPVWVWVLLVALFIGLVSWIGARSGSRRKASPPPVAATTPQPDATVLARTAYADARWLYDQLTPSLGVWKGDSQYQIQSGSGTPMSDRNAVWAEADTRLQSARDALYQVESMDPQAPIATASRDLVTSLNSVREGVDRLAAARLATLTGQGSAETEAAAAEDLSARRSTLQASLSRFSQHL